MAFLDISQKREFCPIALTEFSGERVTDMADRIAVRRDR
jgi:hypothetical protein